MRYICLDFSAGVSTFILPVHSDVLSKQAKAKLTAYNYLKEKNLIWQ